jgi:hypothetical protein
MWDLRRSNSSMGVTMNHIAAVTVPMGGAWLWKLTSNYQLPFWIGVGVAFISLLANYRLPHGKSARLSKSGGGRIRRISGAPLSVEEEGFRR